jgi:VWFA-related protein
VTAAVLAAIATTTPGAAQQDQQPPTVPTFRGMIDAVRVDVIVTDEAGRPITDLTRDDFVLTEDGQPQAVESFEAVRIDVTQRADDAGYVSRIRTLDDEEREARHDDVRLFVIYSASANIGLQDAARVIEPLVDFVESLPPRDMVAVVDNWSLISAMMLSRDRSEAVRAIRRLTDEDVAQRRRNMLLNGDLLEPPGAEDPILGLEAVSNRLAALRDGRQTIIYLGRGIWSRGNTDIDLTRLIGTLNRNNTSVYVLDPAGLTPGVSRMRTVDLRALAEQTGGRAIVNTNQVKEGLDAVAADASFYYLLGYTSQAPADGKFHKIGVTVRRSGAQVRARSGFWSFTTRAIESRVEPPRAPQQVQQALASIAASASPSRTIRTWIGTHRGEAGQTRVALVWEPAPDAGGGTPTHVSIVATGSGGEVFKGSSPDPPPDGAGPAPRDPVRREVTFDAPPGPLKVQLSVESETGRLALETHTIQVPDRSTPRAQLSTPRVFVGRTAPELRSILSNPASIPAPRREFVRTDRLLVRVDVYPADAGPSAAFLNRLGQKMFDLVVAQPAAGGAHQIEVPLSSVPAGEYLIEVRAGGDEGARELVPLRIR